ncbi:hypothetical protein I7I53_01853 [Histoplasma capsulatum var. duboisii H88]|uniref:Uncharacterized protein n=1 Tax=Ajellomyces capsulatus (strain H88) TaxID=544711 RepID=A0A8A1LK03_AJEC8|nr:hypothetical protein I7I53_01853 [Histoplasma capsulatum var. duboisii H88]
MVFIKTHWQNGHPVCNKYSVACVWHDVNPPCTIFPIIADPGRKQEIVVLESANHSSTHLPPIVGNQATLAHGALCARILFVSRRGARRQSPVASRQPSLDAG